MAPEALGPMVVEAIHHVQIAAPPGSEEDARRFYGTILGLDEVPKPASLAGRGGAWFRGRGVEIHVGVEAAFRPARKAHVAFRVSDLPAFRQHLEDCGVTTREDEPLPGYDRFYADDPFGNRLEFLEPTDR